MSDSEDTPPISVLKTLEFLDMVDLYAKRKIEHWKSDPADARIYNRHIPIIHYMSKRSYYEVVVRDCDHIRRYIIENWKEILRGADPTTR